MQVLGCLHGEDGVVTVVVEEQSFDWQSMVIDELKLLCHTSVVTAFKVELFTCRFVWKPPSPTTKTKVLNNPVTAPPTIPGRPNPIGQVPGTQPHHTLMMTHPMMKSRALCHA
jgi:hypothetical protein